MLPISAQEVQLCIELLERARQLDPASSDYLALERAAAALRKTAKARRKRSRRQATTEHDQHLLRATGLAQQRLGAIAETPDAMTLRRDRTCYVCGVAYRELHAHYHQLCRSCGDASVALREQHVDLTGRRALVTGGRIKIGFATALRLLRAGAHVSVTTRFPNDAVRRFRAEADFDAFSQRLQVHGVDFRWLGPLIAWLDRLGQGDPFDILINNAAQTVWRPAEYYRELYAHENAASGNERWIASSSRGEHQTFGATLDTAVDALQHHATAALFPREQRDAYGNPLDLRRENSWVQELADIHPIDFVESQLVNSMAPFLICSRLKQNLLRARHPDRYIVNVSAVEGAFARPEKPTRHPHTNMAKAALNMLTRTSAADYAQSGIYMVSVDPGWMSHEVPHHRVAQHEQAGVHTPLDADDAATRVCDPVVRGIQGAPISGVLLKDFRVVPW